MHIKEKLQISQEIFNSFRSQLLGEIVHGGDLIAS